MVIRAVITAVIAYFCGCFNGAVIVSKYILRDDVRNHGSGNAGLTNFYRTFGGPLTGVVILCDVLKAVVAVLLGGWIAGGLSAAEFPAVCTAAPAIYGKYWAALFCLLGHMFPCMFGFRGGKGILSGGTIVIIMDWRIALVAIGLFLILAVATRYVSLGSMVAGASFPFTTWFVFRDPVILVLGILCGGLTVWQHRSNFRRLLKGEESKFYFHHHDRSREETK